MYSYELTRQRESIEQLEIDYDTFMEYQSKLNDHLLDRIEDLEADVNMLVKELKRKKR